MIVVTEPLPLRIDALSSTCQAFLDKIQPEPFFRLLAGCTCGANRRTFRRQCLSWIWTMLKYIHDYIWHHQGNSGGYIIKMGFTWHQSATAVSVEMQTLKWNQIATQTARCFKVWIVKCCLLGTGSVSPRCQVKIWPASPARWHGMQVPRYWPNQGETKTPLLRCLKKLDSKRRPLNFVCSHNCHVLCLTFCTPVQCPKSTGSQWTLLLQVLIRIASPGHSAVEALDSLGEMNRPAAPGLQAGFLW